ncbi:hypothetical protein SORBI_3001G211800 [Sorghum bicolor]|uniref:Uncharacterized protein n=3 Tax=Sorghum bicolor TaxID=4558 RepID=A0A1B6QK32_SORBI|nr:hypothetical protein SORBI_3001G211800 [Sorghum bicolor]
MVGSILTLSLQLSILIYLFHLPHSHSKFSQPHLSLSLSPIDPEQPWRSGSMEPTLDLEQPWRSGGMALTPVSRKGGVAVDEQHIGNLGGGVRPCCYHDEEVHVGANAGGRPLCYRAALPCYRHPAARRLRGDLAGAQFMLLQ